MTQQNRSSASQAQDEAAQAAPDAPLVLGDEIEPDESRTPEQFADDELLTLEQAAVYCNVPATTVRGWIESNLLSAEAEGSIQRVRRSDLERMGNPEATAAQEFEADHANDAAS